MTSPISSGGINSINLMRETAVFQKNEQKPQNPYVENDFEVKAPPEVEKKFTNHNISEIREIAQNAGAEELTDEDIKYGLFFGRSVIVNYRV